MDEATNAAGQDMVELVKMAEREKVAMCTRLVSHVVRHYFGESTELVGGDIGATVENLCKRIKALE